MNEFIEDNKRKIVTIAIIILATIIIGIVNMLMNGKSTKVTKESALKELGTAYYEEIYYSKLKEAYPKDYEYILEKYSNEGGKKVTLLTLLTDIQNAKYDIFIDDKARTSCDMTLTYINILPKAPYGIKDYEIKTTLKCDVGNVANESGE